MSLVLERADGAVLDDLDASDAPAVVAPDRRNRDPHRRLLALMD
jgi:hypothetical protein